MKKRCRTCGEVKSLDSFYRGAGEYGRRGTCTVCTAVKRAERRCDPAAKKKAAAYAKAWRAKNREKAREVSRCNQRRHLGELRERVLVSLGEKCARCPVVDRRLLHVDHVRDDGAEERRAFRGNRTAFYNNVLAFPTCYQLLCPNCNHRKRLEAATGPTTKMSAWSAKTAAKYKAAALACLGGRCRVCRIEDEDVLCFDHKAGGGNADRRLLSASRYKDVTARPTKYQLLCHNCHWLKHH